MADPREVLFSSNLPIDQILGTFEGSFVAAHPPGGVQLRTNDTFDTGISETTFFQGIYSIDGGLTYKDFNTGYDELRVFGRSNSGTFTVAADNFSFAGNTDYTVDWKVMLIAKSDQGDVDAQPIGAPIIFDSRLNYQKILVDEKRAISIPNTDEEIENFTHDLGYVPNIRSFMETTTTFGAGGNLARLAGMYDTMYLCGEFFSAGATAPGAGEQSLSGVNLNDSRAQVVMRNAAGVGTFTGSLYMRVYYDA